MRIEFDWDTAKSVSNAAKHGVAFHDAMTVFRDPLARSMLDPDSLDEGALDHAGRDNHWKFACGCAHLGQHWAR
jgi:uncharacterized DUF497 family protein